MPNSSQLPSHKPAYPLDDCLAVGTLAAPRSHGVEGIPGDDMSMVLMICAPRSSSTVVEPTKILIRLPAHQEEGAMPKAKVVGSTAIDLLALYSSLALLAPEHAPARSFVLILILIPATTRWPNIPKAFRCKSQLMHLALVLGTAGISNHLSYTSSCMKTLSSFFVSSPFRVGRMADYRPLFQVSSSFSSFPYRDECLALYCRKAIRWTGELSLTALRPSAELVF